MITLADTLKVGCLDDFIAQEKARGIGSVDFAAFDRLIGKAAKSPRAKDRTSRSASRDGSSGKKTRPNT